MSQRIRNSVFLSVPSPNFHMNMEGSEAEIAKILVRGENDTSNTYSVKSSSDEDLSKKRRQTEKMNQKIRENRSQLTRKLQDKKLEKKRLETVLRPLEYGNKFRWLIDLREMEIKNLESSLLAMRCSKDIITPKTEAKYSPVGDQVISDVKGITYLYNHKRTCSKELWGWYTEMQILARCPKKVHYPNRFTSRRRLMAFCPCLQPKELNRPNWQYKMEHGNRSLAEERKVLREMKVVEEGKDDDDGLRAVIPDFFGSKHTRAKFAVLREMQQIKDAEEAKAFYDNYTGLQAVIPDFLGSKQHIRARIRVVKDELKELYKEDETFNANMRRAKKQLEAAENEIKTLESKLGA